MSSVEKTARAGALASHAIRIERWGPPESLVHRDIGVPPPGPGEVRLRVAAVGVNFADLVMRAGLYGTVPPRPFSPGFEVAGEVESVGTDVEGWKPGDRAVALLRHGGYAGHVVVSVRQLFRYPDGLSPVEAAAVPVVFLTAWVCLFEAARARSVETVLILNAAGGVGPAATQLALRAGLRVIGTAGAEHKRAFVTDTLGGEACFDSHGDWEGEVRSLVGKRGIDVALDAAGGRSTQSCRRLLAPLGRLVFYGLSSAFPGRKRDWPRVILAWLRTPRLHPLSLVIPNIGVLGVHLLHLKDRESLLAPALAEVFAGIEAGELRPILDKTFPLTRDGAVAAHQHIHARGNIGKVVLTAD